MAAKFFLVAIFTVAFAKAQENNQICSCDTEQDIKDNNDLWGFLKKLSVDVSDEIKELYSISPGNLYQFDCSHCDEKLRKKRKIEEPELPAEADKEDAKEEAAKEEVAKEETGVDSVEEIDREKRYIKFHDSRCPKGYSRLHRYCLPTSQIEDLID